MIGSRHLAFGTIVALALVLVTSGTAPLGRVMMSFGLPRLAEAMIEDPGQRGVALYRAGLYDAAAEAFATANQPYNQGLAAAQAGDYAGALAAWDRVLSDNPADRETRANHAIVTGLFAGTEFEAVAPPADRDLNGPNLLAEPGQGGVRAASTGADANNPSTGFWMPEIVSSGLRRVPKLFDAQFVTADGRWLTTLEDQPGVYLRARLLAEQKTRQSAGTALPIPEDPQ